MTLSLIALLTGASIAAVFAGGAFFALGMTIHGLAFSGLGAGWLGVLYGTLLRMAADPAKKPALAEPDLDHSTPV